MNHLNHEFDELIRQKLADYSEPPDMRMLDQIHTKKNRVLKWYGLYRLLIIGSAIGLGLWGSYQVGNHAAYSNAASYNDAGTTTQQQTDRDIRVSDPLATESHTAYDYTGEMVNTVTSNRTGNNTGNNNAAKAQGNSAVSGTQSATKQAIAGAGKGTNKQAVAGNQSNTTAKQNNSTITAKQNKNAIQKPVTKSAANAKNTAPATAGKNNLNTNTSGKAAGKDTKAKTDPAVSKEAKDAGKKAAEKAKAEPGETGKDEASKDRETGTCHAKFDYYISYNGEVNFTNFSETEAGSTVKWEFGDGETSIKSDPVHKYNRSGTYNVALHIINKSNRCESSFNKIVSIGGPAQVPVHIKGIVRASGQELGNAMIELLRYDDTEKTYQVAARTVSDNSGLFDFNPIKQGKYVIRANPTDKTPGFTTTYFGNTHERDYAAEVVVFENESVLSGYNIDLYFTGAVPQTDQPGNLVAENGSSGRLVLILDNNNNVVGSTSVDANGNFKVGNISSGNYRIFDPVSGKSSNELSLGAGSSGNTSSLGGESGSSTGSAVSQESLTLSPNPARDVVNFGLQNAEAEEAATIVIVNASGVEVMRRQQNVGPNFSQSQIDVSQLSPGVYYVMVFRGTKKVISNRLVKQFDSTR